MNHNIPWGNRLNSRLNHMAQTGGVKFRHGTMIDTYNQQCHYGIAVTILAGVSARNHYFVITEDEI